MEEETGRPIRPDDCPSLKRKKKEVTKHPNNHMTKPYKTRRQNKGLYAKSLKNYAQKTFPFLKKKISTEHVKWHI